MKRIAALDIAKGIAIITVVLGHIVSQGTVPGADWYWTLKVTIYSFHMPLFMALSGMALGLSWRHRASWGEVGQLVIKRIKTLMVPYLVFGISIVAGKLIAQQFMFVDNAPESFLSGILSIVLYPMYSASVFLWYIQILAMYFLIIPWLLQADAKRVPWILLAVGIVLNQFEWTTLLNIKGIVKYLPFFSAGILIGQFWSQIISKILAPRFTVIWVLPITIAILYSINVQWLPRWFIAILSIPAVLNIALSIRGSTANALSFLGNHTLSIYLMNTIAIGIAKALMLPFIPWRDGYFWIYFFVLLAAGLLVPIIIKLWIVRVRPSFAAYI